jgi:hypothetical protein
VSAADILLALAAAAGAGVLIGGVVLAALPGGGDWVSDLLDSLLE